MSINSFLGKSLLTMLLATITGFPNITNERNLQQKISGNEISANLEDILNLMGENKASWKTVKDYEEFVRSVVDKNYISDVEEIYSFFNIKREIPKYGFKENKLQFTCLDCEGAVYKENSDSIYFYSSCSEELFKRYIEFYKKDNIKEELTDRIHHFIKHEAAHAFYYDLGKKLGAYYLFNVKHENTSMLYNLQHNLVEEGVADYIANKGELTKNAKGLINKDFKYLIENRLDIYLPDLGFLLVKPILDLNFEKGIEELIRNPLTKEDLNDLPAYRERIKNIKSPY